MLGNTIRELTSENWRLLPVFLCVTESFQTSLWNLTWSRAPQNPWQGQPTAVPSWELYGGSAICQEGEVIFRCQQREGYFLQEVLWTCLAPGQRGQFGLKGHLAWGSVEDFRWKKLPGSCGARVEGSDCLKGTVGLEYDFALKSKLRTLLSLESNRNCEVLRLFWKQNWSP